MKIEFKYQGRSYELAAADGDYVAERVRVDGAFYELDLLEDLRAIPLPEAPLVVDVGANIGNHTLYFAGVMGARVMAFEPEAANLESLNANVLANGFEDRVQVFGHALGDRVERGRMVQRIAGNAGTFAVDRSTDGDVEVLPLDSVLAPDEQVDLIKIDVEGFELEVLLGARRILKTHKPVITLECHSPEHYAGISEVLSPLGYVVVDIGGRSDNFTWVHEKSLGAVRVKNLVEVLELRRVRRQFRQVYLATDRISNRVRSDGDASTQWRKQVGGKIDGLGASLLAVREEIVAKGDAAGTGIATLSGSLVAVREGLAASAEATGSSLATLGDALAKRTSELGAALASLRDVAEGSAGAGGQFREELSGYWKALVDMVAEIRGGFTVSGDRLAEVRADLAALGERLPRETEQLRATLLREIGAELEDRGRLQASMVDAFRTIAEQMTVALEATGARLGQDLDVRLARRDDEIGRQMAGFGEVIGAALESHGQQLVGTVGQVSDALTRQQRDVVATVAGIGGLVRDLQEAHGESTRRTDRLIQALAPLLQSLTVEVRSRLADVDARFERQEKQVEAAALEIDAGTRVAGQALAAVHERADLAARALIATRKDLEKAIDVGYQARARRELDLNDLVAKLMECQEQLRVTTGELLQSQWDRERLLAAGTAARRELLEKSLAVREWEGAYQLLHGSRSLRAGRKLLGLVGRARPPHDVDSRRRDVAVAVSNYLRQSALEQPEAPPAALREVPNPRARGRDRIRAGVATMPGREEGLAVVLDSICPQVDEVFVYLNGFDEAPACVSRHDNVRAFLGPDVGDRGKFRFIDGFTGYFISIDDDIAYPRFYVRTLIDGIERYGRKAAVGWHGSQLLEDFSDYYDPKSRRVLSFGSERGKDTQVHLLGTGCTAFHTDTIRISYCDFLKPNMADIFFALEGQRQQVPFVVLAHRKGWARSIDFKSSPSISGESMKSSGSRIDVRSITNSLVNTQGKWLLPPLPESIARESFVLALIGRTDKTRWKKGGILKSSHLTQEMLDPYGVKTHLVDIDQGDLEGLGGVDPHVVMIYPGDPDRPDYAKVEYLVDFHASRGRVVLVNLSLNSVQRRSEFVNRRIRSWRDLYGDRVWLMTFTDRAHELAELAPVSDAIFAVPKTVEIPDLRVRSFGATRGIFLGDYGKLCDETLLGFPIREALDALRAAVPEAELFAVTQYRPKVAQDLGIRILPYLSDDYAATLRDARLMVNLVKYATFEMVPTELAGMGVPIVHPRMSFSLSDYLGLASFEVRDVASLAATTALLYRDPMVWAAASRAGEARGASADFRVLSGQMYARLLQLSKLAGPR